MEARAVRQNNKIVVKVQDEYRCRVCGRVLSRTECYSSVCEVFRTHFTGAYQDYLAGKPIDVQAYREMIQRNIDNGDYRPKKRKYYIANGGDVKFGEQSLPENYKITKKHRKM